MLFEEYKKIFEEILELTEELELICKNKKDGDFDKVFEKRDKLFQKLETPEDVTEERIEEIRLIRDKIQEKNKFILRTIQVSRNEIKKALLEIKQENNVIEAYKIPKGDINASIFDSFE